MYKYDQTLSILCAFPFFRNFTGFAFKYQTEVCVRLLDLLIAMTVNADGNR